MNTHFAPFATDTLPIYINSPASSLSEISRGESSRRRHEPSCLLSVSSVWATSQERCPERRAVSRSSAMEATSAAGTPSMSGGAADPVSLGREAAAAPVSGWKRKRDAEEGESGSDEPQMVERLPIAAVHPAVPVPPTPPPLQGLLNACRAVFDGSSSTPPTPDAVSLIRGIMDAIGPDDVRLRDEVRLFNKMNTAGRQNPPIITCKPIYASSKFTIAVFFMPLGSVMPLHDHPGMTVFTKLLIGSARVEAYDWVRRPRALRARGSRMLAEKVLDHDATAASGSWVLFPKSGGNIHRFVAGDEEHCAFLDVLTLPYARTERRRRRSACYQDIPYEPCPCVVRALGDEGKEMHKRRRLQWLQKVSMPSGLRIVNLRYRGPPPPTSRTGSSEH